MCYPAETAAINAKKEGHKIYVENLYPYMLDAANVGKITFEKVVKVCSTNVAKIFGCENKGSIAIGKERC